LLKKGKQTLAVLIDFDFNLEKNNIKLYYILFIWFTTYIWYYLDIFNIMVQQLILYFITIAYPWRIIGALVLNIHY